MADKTETKLTEKPATNPYDPFAALDKATELRAHRFACKTCGSTRFAEFRYGEIVDGEFVALFSEYECLGGEKTRYDENAVRGIVA